MEDVPAAFRTAAGFVRKNSGGKASREAKHHTPLQCSRPDHSRQSAGTSLRKPLIGVSSAVWRE
jgi:hypothetical protein